MNFLNVGPWELTVILIIAILLVGPKRMAEIARTVGRTANQMRRLSNEFLGTIQSELQATEQETRQALESVAIDRQESAELRAVEHETRQTMEEIVENIENIENIIKGEPETKERHYEEAAEEAAEEATEEQSG